MIRRLLTLPRWGQTPSERSGLLLDLAFSMGNRISAMASSTFSHLQQITCLHPYLDGASLTTLVNALVILRTDYCNALYMELHLKAIWKVICSSQAGIGNIKILPSFTCPGLFALAANMLWGQFQGVDANIQSFKWFRTLLLV